jgi:hypothetical protein
MPHHVGKCLIHGPDNGTSFHRTEVQSLRRSLKLDPNNQNARALLKKL